MKMFITGILVWQFICFHTALIIESEFIALLFSGGVFSLIGSVFLYVYGRVKALCLSLFRKGRRN